jgi:hypothetical protein
MAEMIDLIQNLYDSLQEQFGTPGDNVGPGGLFLAFEKLGIGLSANDFKLQPTDSAFNPAIAAQHESTLVNFVAQLDSDGFILPRGDLSPTVTGQYGQILSNASYGVQPASDAALTAFLQSKGAALRTLDESKLPADLAQSYWAASFVPAVWYEDQDQTIWQTYTSSTGESATPTTPPAPTPPIRIQREWSWRVVTPEAAPDVAAIRILQAVPANQRFASDIFLTQVAARPQVLTPEAAATSIAPVAMARVASSAAMVSAQSPAARLAIRPVASLTSLSASSVRASTVATAALPVERVAAPEGVGAAMRLNPLTATNAALSSVVLNLPAQPTSSTNFEISFKYCVASVARPWLSSDFLTATNWYMPGLQVGALARGIYAKAAQRFGLLPAKLLLVKELSIRAAWSEQDRTFAQNSASLGPFSLINSSFDKNELTAPGMQIIGWFCQVVPVLPPMADPAATGATATSGNGTSATSGTSTDTTSAAGATSTSGAETGTTTASGN